MDILNYDISVQKYKLAIDKVNKLIIKLEASNK